MNSTPQGFPQHRRGAGMTPKQKEIMAAWDSADHKNESLEFITAMVCDMADCSYGELVDALALYTCEGQA